MGEDFAQGMPAAGQQLRIATQGPPAFAAPKDKITRAAWKTKPSWHIVASHDRMINPDLEQALAKKMKATTTTPAPWPCWSRPRR